MPSSKTRGHRVRAAIGLIAARAVMAAGAKDAAPGTRGVVRAVMAVAAVETAAHVAKAVVAAETVARVVMAEAVAVIVRAVTVRRVIVPPAVATAAVKAVRHAHPRAATTTAPHPSSRPLS